MILTLPTPQVCHTPVSHETGPEKATSRGGRALLCGLALVTGVFAAGESADLTTRDLMLLDAIEARSIRYFIEHTDATTGLTRDRAPADGTPSEAHASVAASGFALSAWCIASERGMLPRELARANAIRTLRFLLENTDHARGWFYHFLDTTTGRRAWLSEASTIDTALFLQGALFAREYFGDAEIRSLVDQIYERIDWQWALNGGTTLAHGWLPESGFLPYRWDRYAESLGMYLLGLGAPANALPANAWHAWRREPVVDYAGRTFLHCAPLFTHQYSHAWFDFRSRHDNYANYWRNSVDATLAQRQWCADQSTRFPMWSLKLWGLTASDSARGYVAWGGPVGGDDRLDGTVVPCAPGGSLPFAPRECLDTLHEMRRVGGEAVWQRYGFVDAFNPHNGWVARDVIAIDQGIMLLMAENLRSGLVWDHFMRAPEVQRALALAGFREENEFDLPPLLAVILPR